MTTYSEEKIKCAVCGAVNSFPVLASTSSFGSPDLDLRPAPMQRYTMESWLQECPNCGYVSKEVSDYSPVTAEFLNSDHYCSCDGIPFRSELAKKFYRHCKINIQAGNIDGVFESLLHAAWACDDEKDTENAARCRKLAIPFINEMIGDQKRYIRRSRKDFQADLERESKDLKEENYYTEMIRNEQKELINLLLMKADILRRAGCFDRLITEFSNVQFYDPFPARILAFEIMKANEKDPGSYRVSDIPKQ